jgi:hypothetical protein
MGLGHSKLIHTRVAHDLRGYVSKFFMAVINFVMYKASVFVKANKKY